MNVATIIYARSSTPGGWLIRRWPDSAPAEWSHAGILIPRDPDLELSAMVWHATFPKGFHGVTLDEFLDRYKHTASVDYEVRMPASFQYAWCAAREGQRYAVGTVLGRLFGLRKSQDKKDHCSEVVENFLADCGAPRRWRGAHHLVTPNASYHNTCGVMQ